MQIIPLLYMLMNSEGTNVVELLIVFPVENMLEVLGGHFDYLELCIERREDKRNKNEYNNGYIKENYQ